MLATPFRRLRLCHLSRILRRSLSSSIDEIKEGDHVVLCLKRDPERGVHFIGPLERGKCLLTTHGKVDHVSIIGKRSREVVSSSKEEFRVSLPTLDEYIRLTKRIVTPIYSNDANLIVSLLDLHVSRPTSVDGQVEEPLEILEGGTGQGALTLHLARAIHGANPPLNQVVQNLMKQLDKGGTPGTHEMEQLAAWKSTRGAVIHSVDSVETYSRRAQKVVQGFRQGLYRSDVDFYTGDISKWIAAELARRSGSSIDGTASGPTRPFLNHIILDCPSSHWHFTMASAALHPNGLLVTFHPSISQIHACMQTVRNEKLPLWSEKVLEVSADWTGGREWDVRFVKPRVTMRQERGLEMPPTVDRDTKILDAEVTGSSDVDEETEAAEVSQSDTHIDSDESSSATPLSTTNSLEGGFEIVSRPRAWIRRVGGGFIGVWRKKRPLQEA